MGEESRLIFCQARPGQRKHQKLQSIQATKLQQSYMELYIKYRLNMCDRIMSPFCESAKMAAPPLNKFPRSKIAPPLPETTAPVLTSSPSPFYKSHCSPRLRAAPSFPWPAWQFGPAIKLCSMDVSFLVSFL
jgi:hypothetical protein